VQHAGEKEYKLRAFYLFALTNIVGTCGLANPFVDSSEGT